MFPDTDANSGAGATNGVFRNNIIMNIASTAISYGVQNGATIGVAVNFYTTWKATSDFPEAPSTSGLMNINKVRKGNSASS